MPSASKAVPVTAASSSWTTTRASGSFTVPRTTIGEVPRTAPSGGSVTVSARGAPPTLTSKLWVSTKPLTSLTRTTIGFAPLWRLPGVHSMRPVSGSIVMATGAWSKAKASRSPTSGSVAVTS